MAMVRVGTIRDLLKLSSSERKDLIGQLDNIQQEKETISFEPKSLIDRKLIYYLQHLTDFEKKILLVSCEQMYLVNVCNEDMPDKED